MQKRHHHVSPTMDLMAKKVLNIPEFTAAFIGDIFEIEVETVEILEGTQIHLQEFNEDEPFATAVDVRARLRSGTEVIIEIQVQKQKYFVQRFHYYLSNQLVENARALREKGRTHEMYQKLTPVYGLAILEKTIFPDKSSPVNRFGWTNLDAGEELLLPAAGGAGQNLGRLAFIELDKYNEDIDIKDRWRQWLEFFGNYLFSKRPISIIERTDRLLDSSSWTKEEKDMIDEHIRRQENYDMDIYSAREEGLEQGLLQVAKTMLANGYSLEEVQRNTGLAVDLLRKLQTSFSSL